jgi:hypothetical protein
MRYLPAASCLALAALMLAAPAAALSPEEVVRLKKAGVSEETIRLLMEQEAAGGRTSGPMEKRDDRVIYRAGQGAGADAARMRRHEAWKEKKSLESLPGIVVDQREED